MNLEWKSAPNEDNWIPLAECQDGYLYIIAARNASIGIFRKARKEFEIARKKLGDCFSSYEEHWDCGEPYGTAKPLKEISKAPEFYSEGEFLAFMDETYKELSKE